jgi:magnesium transporter
MSLQFEITKEFIDGLKSAINLEDDVTVKSILKNFHAADIAEIFNELNTEESKYLITKLEGETAADVIAELDEDDREKYLKAMPGEVIAKQFIHQMDSDDAADLMADLPEKKQEEVLKHIDDIEQAGDIVDLLSYDENSAGGLMAKELISVNENWSILKCLKEMSKQAENVDEVYYVYAVDDDNKLKGTVSLKRMLLSQNSTLIKDIINAEIRLVKTDTPGEEVANIMDKYDLVALPVVDSLRRLIGRITIDDVVDFIREEAEKDYQMASGITEDIEPTDKIRVLTRARLPWLFIGLVGGVLGALVIGHYSPELEDFPKLAFFKSMGLESTSRRLFKEFIVAFTNGLILAGLIFAYSFLVNNSMALTVTVSSSLLIVIIFAALFGTTIPLLLNKMNIDPALATGPFITTMNDILGLFIYLMIGKILFGIL